MDIVIGILIGIMISLGVVLIYLTFVKTIYTKASYVSANDAMYIVNVRINDLLEAGIRPDNIIIRLSYNYGKKLFENHNYGKKLFENHMVVKGVRVILDELLPADYGLVVETRRFDNKEQLDIK